MQRPSSIRKSYPDPNTDVWSVFPPPLAAFVHSYKSLTDHLSSLTALLSALDDLDALFENIEDAYKASLEHDNIEVRDEKR
jgi:DNA-directed RNA polymerases I and III subunit RPAC2